MDVTKENFLEVLPSVLEAIKGAHFIAIDSEFTGLTSDPGLKSTYFDSASSLYDKKRQNMKNISICQFGISIFKGLRDVNSYDVTTFNFYVRPHQCLSVDPQVSCQISGIEFLQSCNFNFNKWLYSGVPCLNSEEEEEVRRAYSDILNEKSSLSPAYEVLDIIHNVKLWIEDPKHEETMEVTISDPTDLLIFISLVHKRFRDILASLNNGKIILTKIDASEQPIRAKEEANKALEMVIHNLKGLSTVFNHLVKAKVPLIVHNGVSDLILMYKQFHRSLPKKFETFASDVNQMFPTVYDTKELAYTMANKFKIKDSNPLDFLFKTSLPTVVANLRKEIVVYYRPTAKHNPLTNKYDIEGDEFYHEAGFDAFAAGYCFLNLSHIHAMMPCTDSHNERPLSPRELVHSLSAYKNILPIQQSGVKYISLDSKNEEVSTNTWLIVQPRGYTDSISPSIVSSYISVFGRFDVIQWNKKAVLVAAARQKTIDEVFRTLKDNQTFKVSRYRAIKHSPVVRSIAFSCAILSVGLSTLFVADVFYRGKLRWCSQ